MNSAIWLTFEAGMLLQIAAQVNASLASSSNGLEGWKGVSKWLRAHAIPIVIRFAFGNGVFGYVLGNKAAVDSLFGLPIPISASTAIFIGFTVDSVLDKVVAVLPWFKVEIPQVAPPPPPFPPCSRKPQ